MTSHQPSLVEVRDRFGEVGQDHVFRFVDGLDDAALGRLVAQAATIDLERVGALRSLQASASDVAAHGTLEPVTLVRTSELSAAEILTAREAGESLLARGRVAVVLVAGGQGTRLGFDGPKGAYPIGPVTGRTLFEWFAGRIRGLGRRFGRPPPIWIMTSDATHVDTVAFFDERDRLGLRPDGLRFFQQGMIPALDDEGRLFLDRTDRIFVAPNGHGGVVEGLAGSGALAEMAARGIDEIFYFQVDNPLAVIADPLFLGLHRTAKAEMSTKVVAKTDPDEKVGVVGRLDGRLGVIEYSELPDEERVWRDDGGRLVFGAGNIAVHAMRRSFVERIADSTDGLPYHLARKTIPYVDETGERVVPERANGTKFERFVFDALGLAERSVTLEVERADEFAPVKNAEGADSPQTARDALTDRFRRWYESAGCPFPDADAGDGVRLALEIDPEYADDAESLRAKLEAST